MADYKKYFRRVIGKSFPATAESINAAIDNNFNFISPDIQFASTSRNPIDKRLDFCSYVLALIKTLDERGETYEKIRQICLEIVTDYVRPKNKIQQLLKRVPAKLMNTRLFAIFLK